MNFLQELCELCRNSKRVSKPIGGLPEKSCYGTGVANYSQMKELTDYANIKSLSKV